MNTIREPARDVPVIEDCDLCVVGGSCTGVFAAVRAARLGLRVALIELHNSFGGVATARLVNVWHSLWDTGGELQIIGGLTIEVIQRLRKSGAIEERVRTDPNWQFAFSPAELALVLDDLVREHPGIRPFLHARCVAVAQDDGLLSAVVIEDKSGRRAIRARQFIDASGDGDLAALAELPTWRDSLLQPPTMAAMVTGLTAVRRADPGFKLGQTIMDPGWPRHLRQGFAWDAPVPGCGDIRLVFATRVHGVDCSDADQLTSAEMEGRRQVGEIIDILRERVGHHGPIGLAALPACIGIRETRHVHCLYRLLETDVLEGVSFPDAIAQGSYRVDVHHQGGDGLTFRYLDGREVRHYGDDRRELRRWRDVRADDPTFYGIPYRSLVPKGSRNLLIAGRAIDADRGAYGAVRVMVNTNQTGEAAGVAAWMAQRDGIDVAAVDPMSLRTALNAGGSSLQGVGSGLSATRMSPIHESTGKALFP